ncbi:MAG: NlpC/P60 family protein [Porphyromonas sp.]|nr:NlpC/P60 family protein [Porphyromonas sp.]
MSRKIWLFFLCLYVVSVSSCRTTKAPVQYPAYLPEARLTKIEAREMADLAQEVSVEIGMPVTPEDNLLLYVFIADWRNVPYRYGSVGKRGTDCSGFVMSLYEEVYGISIGRMSAASLMDKTVPIDRSELKEGDLVFFNIRNRTGGRASHVGVYLRNDLFVHAATKTGITISSLTERYYSRTYLGAGRIRERI